MITNVRVCDRSLYARPDGGRLTRYVVTFERDGKPRRLKATFTTRKEAREAANEVRKCIASTSPSK